MTRRYVRFFSALFATITVAAGSVAAGPVKTAIEATAAPHWNADGGLLAPSSSPPLKVSFTINSECPDGRAPNTALEKSKCVDASAIAKINSEIDTARRIANSQLNSNVREFRELAADIAQADSIEAVLAGLADLKTDYADTLSPRLASSQPKTQQLKVVYDAVIKEINELKPTSLDNAKEKAFSLSLKLLAAVTQGEQIDFENATNTIVERVMKNGKYTATFEQAAQTASVVFSATAKVLSIVQAASSFDVFAVPQMIRDTRLIYVQIMGLFQDEPTKRAELASAILSLTKDLKSVVSAESANWWEWLYLGPVWDSLAGIFKTTLPELDLKLQAYKVEFNKLMAQADDVQVRLFELQNGVLIDGSADPAKRLSAEQLREIDSKLEAQIAEMQTSLDSFSVALDDGMKQIKTGDKLSLLYLLINGKKMSPQTALALLEGKDFAQFGSTSKCGASFLVEGLVSEASSGFDSILSLLPVQ